MRVSVVQMNPGADKRANIDQARRLIEQAVREDRPDIVSLPEVWSCLGGTHAGKFEQAEILQTGDDERRVADAIVLDAFHLGHGAFFP